MSFLLPKAEKIFWFGIIIFSLIAGTYSCHYLIRTTKISEILHKPSKYHGKQVRIEGKVIESILVFGIGYFSIDDGTGSVAVMPAQTYPKVGEYVSVVGIVENRTVIIGKTALTVIFERGG